jgi:hypothetical protein
MKKLLATLSLATVTVLGALAVNANAQTVAANGLGSSSLFLESGLGASSATTGSINATCLWSGNNSSATNAVTATDTTVVTGGVNQSLQDSGSAWVAWTPGTGTCAAPGSTSMIYAYLSTDSVVGNRCLFNSFSSPSGSGTCKITYPTGDPAPAGSILGAINEVNLPTAVANKLNSATVNFAATDIRPEDAWFAIKRALTPCGTAVATGSQYLGLGYSDGGAIESVFGGAPFHAIDFNVPANPVNYAVTAVGATPIVVAINGPASGFGSTGFTSISSQTLAEFLDGRLSTTGAVNGTSGTALVNTIIREPLSGTYNTMEYNVPNRVNIPASGSTPAQFGTSQDVGLNQPTAQRDCAGDAVGSNPMNITSVGGGLRERAIGTGQELAQVVAATTSSTQFNALGYGFWSAGNFAPFSAATSTAKYLEVDGVDPLLTVTSTPHTGVIPTTAAELENVTLNTVANGTYPIWSLLRFVTVGSTTAPTAIANLSAATQDFVSFGGTAPRPDFITLSRLQGVRSHFVPPLPAEASGTTNGQPNPAADGHVGSTITTCSNAEQGGDVGGVFIKFATDATTCGSQPAGEKVGGTNQRR